VPTDAPTPRFEPDSIARVVTNDLRVRSEPGTHEGSRKLEALLDEGTFAYILDGPAWADGYEWYRVHPYAATSPDGAPPEVGWVAAADKNGELWLDDARVTCSEVTGVSSLVRQDAKVFGTMWCHGDRPLSFEAWITTFDTPPCFEMDPPEWRIEPDWLDPCADNYVELGEATIPQGEGVPIGARLGPAVAVDPDAFPQPGDTHLVEVTGQFEHPEARTCTAEPAVAVPSAPAPDADLVVLACRARFVITSLERS
jgi:hypothetical protein